MDPGPARDVLTVGLGVVTGIFSGAFGVGGAVISTPGVRLLGASPIEAVGTTLPSILPGSISGTARYAREGHVDWRVVGIVACTGTVGAVLGALASHIVPGDGHWLMVLTAAFVGLAAVQLLRPPPSPGPEGAAAAAAAAAAVHHPAGLVALLGAAAGGLSGLLGVGGGTILIPGFTQLLGMPVTRTVATSLACVGILAVPSTITHAVLGDIDWHLAVLLTVGVVPGARIGAAAALRAGEARLRLAVGIFLASVAVIYAAAETYAIIR